MAQIYTVWLDLDGKWHAWGTTEIHPFLKGEKQFKYGETPTARFGCKVRAENGTSAIAKAKKYYKRTLLK